MKLITIDVIRGSCWSGNNQISTYFQEHVPYFKSQLLKRSLWNNRQIQSRRFVMDQVE